MGENEIQKIKPSVVMDNDGLLKPSNLDEAYRMAKAFYQSKLLPQRFNSPEMVMTAMQFVTELGLKPLTAMRQLAVIKGTPSLFGDLPLSLCFASGKLEWIKETLSEKNGTEICSKNKNLQADAFVCVCIVKRKGDPEPMESFFTMDDARKASLLGSPVWKSYPKRMLRYRARSQALKDKFPDALNGVSIAEYDFNELPTDSGDNRRPSIEVRSETVGIEDLRTQLKNDKGAPQIRPKKVQDKKPESPTDEAQVTKNEEKKVEPTPGPKESVSEPPSDWEKFKNTGVSLGIKNQIKKNLSKPTASA